MICPRKLSRVKSKVRSISLVNVPINWWIKFSIWEDYRGLLRTETILKIHEIVKRFSKPLDTKPVRLYSLSMLSFSKASNKSRTSFKNTLSVLFDNTLYFHHQCSGILKNSIFCQRDIFACPNYICIKPLIVYRLDTINILKYSW